MSIEVLKRPEAAPTQARMEEASRATYREACEAVGVVNPDILMDDFRSFLSAADLPVFNLTAVVAFMDDLTARDNPSKMGWEWRPVRDSDRIDHRFGRPATEDWSAVQREIFAAFAAEEASARRRGFFARRPKPAVPRIGVSRTPDIVPASDYYAGADAKVYDRTIPLHALMKIARVEKDFGAGKVVFMITDYVTEPHVVIKPDPFLMAVVPNQDLPSGTGRFVIDVWDEPGFGIAQMLK